MWCKRSHRLWSRIPQISTYDLSRQSPRGSISLTQRRHIIPIIKEVITTRWCSSWNYSTGWRYRWYSCKRNKSCCRWMCEGTRGSRGTRRSGESRKIVAGVRWGSMVYGEFASECWGCRGLVQSHFIHIHLQFAPRSLWIMPSLYPLWMGKRQVKP